MARQLKEMSERAEGSEQAKDAKVRQLEEALRGQERRMADETARLNKQLELSLAQGGESRAELQAARDKLTSQE